MNWWIFIAAYLFVGAAWSWATMHDIWSRTAPIGSFLISLAISVTWPFWFLVKVFVRVIG